MSAMAFEASEPTPRSSQRFVLAPKYKGEATYRYLVATEWNVCMAYGWIEQKRYVILRAVSSRLEAGVACHSGASVGKKRFDFYASPISP